MKKALVLWIGLWFAACSSGPKVSVETETTVYNVDFLKGIDSVTVRKHLRTLSHDMMEGRGTGTDGEKRAVNYISEQFKAAGLTPGGKDGSWFQEVPLLGSTPSVVKPLTFSGANGTFSGDFGTGFTASTDLAAESVKTNAELVFVGYGIVAPGSNWDDYKGLDVRGKIVVSFVNDPPPTDNEPTRFKGDTLTYFGRWTYKQEEARRKGAKGILLIHTTPTASYPFAVVGNGAAREQIQFATPPANPLELKSWISQEMAEKLAVASGSTLEEWFVEAADRNFKPRVLPVTVSAEMKYALRYFSGSNVIGVLPGTEKPDEAILFTSHHDHLGVGKPDKHGDMIYNGAVDNASGVAMMITMATALKNAAIAPKRSILFLSVTAEESGLLGSAYYASHPTFPMNKIVANLNVDSGNVHGRTKDLSGIGAETSDMLHLLRKAAFAEGMTVSPDPNPNAGLFFRSDQLSFARMGVPAFFLNSGKQFIGKPAGYAQEMEAAYTALRYHQPADEFDPTWPMGGLVQQMRVCLRLGYTLAMNGSWPKWKRGAEFEAARK
ncbi:MAG: M20/M25/M40 family metallo-hydrolase [Rhodothermia bacterium]|nr:M20/M25/M40 family metallo-hydrolase [Rhodothermia bacterium]